MTWAVRVLTIPAYAVSSRPSGCLPISPLPITGSWVSLAVRGGASMGRQVCDCDWYAPPGSAAIATKQSPDQQDVQPIPFGPVPPRPRQAPPPSCTLICQDTLAAAAPPPVPRPARPVRMAGRESPPGVSSHSPVDGAAATTPG